MARRHFGKPVMLCLISDLATSRRHSIGFSGCRWAISGSLKMFIGMDGYGRFTPYLQTCACGCAAIPMRSRR